MKGEKRAGFEDTGLRGVRAATSRVSKVNGEAGELLYRGYSIEDLAHHSNFEEVTYLLLRKEMPKPQQLKDFSKDLAAQRKLPPEMLEAFHKYPLTTPPMAVIQSGISLLEGYCEELEDHGKEACERKLMQIIAVLPTMVAAWKRIRKGLEPIEPDPKLSHAANFLYMIKGERPEKAIARFLDVSLILHADHEFNASTFTARVVASTGASPCAAISAALGSLSGPLHGGANAQVMRDLIDIDGAESVEAWVESQFKRGKRVSGMGHAVYKTFDPRAKILQRMAQTMLKDHPEYRWLDMTERMAQATQILFKEHKRKEIYPNVDLYSASIYHVMEIHMDFYPPVFAMSRAAGWSAHILEEKYPRPPVKPTIYRPDCTYVGEVGRKYVPIKKR